MCGDAVSVLVRAQDGSNEITLTGLFTVLPVSVGRSSNRWRV